MPDVFAPLSLLSWLSAENLRPALRGDHDFAPVAPIARGEAPVTPIPTGPGRSLDDLPISLSDGRRLRLLDWLTQADVDVYLVLHEGRLVYERYLHGMSPTLTHKWASMTKAVNGLLAAVLAREGAVDLPSPLSRYVPELADNAFGRATIQQNLDMEVSYAAPPDVTEADWLSAVGLLPPTVRSGSGIRPFVRRYGQVSDHPHGSGFRYNNLATEAAAWALSAATSESWQVLVERRIWQKLRFETDASVVLDPNGVAQASGGIASTPLDLARFAEFLRRALTGSADPGLMAAAVDALQPHDNAALFAAGNITAGRVGFSYRNGFFHVNDGTGSVQMSGRFGQRVHIDPTAATTIVQMAAYPGAGDPVAGAFLSTARAVVRAVAAA